MVKLRDVTSLLLNYATFLRRAKGDLEVAEMALRKAVEVKITSEVVICY
jgi:hypothetical protein